ncbi:MAG: Gfo/Idh/MocA family oxidoreductase [Propionibacteriaceae bacterium]|jgi:predicted dehydrogenase|nr:Gfo/Idh/MocA family oxidoreductase [Propionibacteriaceae bacterium]
MRVALAGLSHPHIAYFTAELAARPGEAELVGVHLDPGDDPARLDGFPAPAFESPERLLDAVAPDVLLVCGVYRRRAAAVLAALERGVAVLADKPVLTDPADLPALEQACRRDGALLSVAFEKRWYAATLQARRLVAQGAVGDLLHLSATGPHKLARRNRPAWYFDGGYGDLVADLPIHDIDLSLALTGAASGSVQARRSGPADFPTLCAVDLDLDTGARSSIDANWLWPESDPSPGRYQMRLTGSRGVIEIDFSRPTVAITTDAPFDGLPAVTPKRPCQDFFDAWQRGQQPEVGTAASLTATRIALLAAQSASLGGRPLPWSAVMPNSPNQP